MRAATWSMLKSCESWEMLWFGRWRLAAARNCGMHTCELTVDVEWLRWTRERDTGDMESSNGRAWSTQQSTIGKMKIVIEMCEKSQLRGLKIPIVDLHALCFFFFIPLFNCGVSLCFKELFSLSVCRQIKFHYILIVPSINSSHIRLDDGAHKSASNQCNLLHSSNTSFTSPSLSIHKL